MVIFINNKEYEFHDSETINNILCTLEITQQKGIAIAVNNNIIYKKDWDVFKLNNNDKVTIIKASQGG